MLVMGSPCRSCLGPVCTRLPLHRKNGKPQVCFPPAGKELGRHHLATCCVFAGPIFHIIPHPYEVTQGTGRIQHNPCGAGASAQEDWVNLHPWSVQSRAPVCLSVCVCICISTCMENKRMLRREPSSVNCLLTCPSFASEPQLPTKN